MSQQLEVIASPALVDLYDLSGKNIVVVDILRATSTICTALYNGAKAIKPVLNVEEALAYRNSEYLLAAERGGEKVKGFSMGNSPREYNADTVTGKRIVLTTTNGTKAMHLSKGGKHILIGSFLNLNALSNYLLSQKEDVLIFCAGWKDKFNLEDFLFAGALAHELKGSYSWECDSTEAALDLYLSVEKDLKKYIGKASHAKRFARLGITQDIGICLQKDSCPVVPILRNGEIVLLEQPENQKG